MGQEEATVLEVRNRIEAIEEEDFRLAFMYQFLIGGEVSEVCGKYAPRGTDAHYVEFQIDKEKIPFVLFIIKTARRSGKLRTCAVPLNPSYEPWAEPVYNRFKERGENYAFMFAKKFKSSTRYYQWHADRVFKNLLWLMDEYQTEKSDGKVEMRYNRFTPLMLRKIRRKNLLEFYHFDEIDLALYGGWKDPVKDPKIKIRIRDIFKTELKTDDLSTLMNTAEKYILKLLKPLTQLEQEPIPIYLQTRSFHELSTRFARAQEISNLVRNINNLSRAKLDAVFFKENMRIVLEMLNPCKNEEAQFITKIASLSALFIVELDPLRKLVHDPKDRKSIRLIEKWLQNLKIPYDTTMIDTWLNINSLRNMEPIHETDPVELKRILDFFRIPMRYPLNYPGLWDEILDHFLLSLNQMMQILNEYDK